MTKPGKPTRENLRRMVEHDAASGVSVELALRKFSQMGQEVWEDAAGYTPPSVDKEAAIAIRLGLATEAMSRGEREALARELAWARAGAPNETPILDQLSRTIAADLDFDETDARAAILRSS